MTSWPQLPNTEWTDSLETLHMFAQIVGKMRMAKGPWLNHSWGVPLYVSPRGLRTSLVPYSNDGFEIELDFFRDTATIATTRGFSNDIPLTGTSVADFYTQVSKAMSDAGMPVTISPVPTEVPNAIGFESDTRAAYSGENARALHGALVQAHRVFSNFRAGFLGKASPVHFFWGSFDLAVTRFSGRTAPAHPGGLPNFPLEVAQEAYSHEVTSVGFWPGNREAPNPIFYAYAYPSPEGFEQSEVQPKAATWLTDLGEFILPYEAVAASDTPDQDLMAFLESTHAAAADLASWPRAETECADPQGPEWWRNRPHSTNG